MSRFLFDQETGNFYHKATGKKAGYCRPNGYIYIGIEGTAYGAHRLAYLLSFGIDPKEHFVDHINHNPSDNRPKNLRLASLQNNTRHTQKARKDSKTGERGVRWRERDKVWYAQITLNGKKKYLGSFQSKDEAAIAAKDARKLYFKEFSGEHDAT